MGSVGYVIGIVIAVVIVAVIVLSHLGPFFWRTHEKGDQQKPRSREELFGDVKLAPKRDVEQLNNVSQTKFKEGE